MFVEAQTQPLQDGAQEPDPQAHLEVIKDTRRGRRRRAREGDVEGRKRGTRGSGGRGRRGEKEEE